ncbi:hypothetical protein [Chryseobacterium caseinilyticum]|uniref:Uncharacterized protein n=1 Tax=Chryseobacterium caseinilyticum TaxID=2771428 RepID=A0ABR8ZGW1_9FLAO|nr:hypothetical protein [Chryseobacterium caseinilyticum]MBD8084543.1 hypothetical protein [Chryseobacterium caseinilyticum]
MSLKILFDNNLFYTREFHARPFSTTFKMVSFSRGQPRDFLKAHNRIRELLQISTLPVTITFNFDFRKPGNFDLSGAADVT